MKKLKLIIFNLTMVMTTGFSSNDQDLTNWNNIKNSQDFVEFFIFSLNAKDSILLSNSIDSLEKYKPKNDCIILTYRNYVQSHSLVFKNFNFVDECEIHIDYYSRYVLSINILENETIEVEYIEKEIEDYHNFLLNIYSSDSTSYDLPMIFSIHENGKEYYSRKIGFFIYSNIIDDTYCRKKNWLKLINEVNNIFETINKAKDLQSLKIYNIPYEELTTEKAELIDKLIPIHILIHFYNLKKIPPPHFNDLIDWNTFMDSIINLEPLDSI